MNENVELRRDPLGESPSVSYNNSISSPSRHSSSSSTAWSSLYVTFKVLQLVNAFRKRVKTRANSASPKKNLATVQDDFCQAFERQAYEEIDRHLGRRHSPPNWKHRHDSFGDREGHSSASRLSTAASSTTSSPSLAAKRVEWLLEEVNRSVTCDNQSLRTIAEKDHLFVRRCAEFRIDRLSLKQLAQLIVIIKDLLATLSRGPVSIPKPKYLIHGAELLDPADEEDSIDESYIANLHHLLLSLQYQLLRQLIARCIELVRKHIVECHQNQGKHVVDWFSEFPNAQHPLSTTWPWSIKPSLAVLWGVCWMFYNYTNFDADGNMVDEQGVVVVPSNIVQQYLSGLHRQQQRQGQAQSPGERLRLSSAERKERESAASATFIGLTEWIAEVQLGFSSTLGLDEVGGRVGLIDPFAGRALVTSPVSPIAAPQQRPTASGTRMTSPSPTRMYQQQQQQQQQSQQRTQQQQHQGQQQPQRQRRAAHDRESWSVATNEYLPVPSSSQLPVGGSGDFHTRLAVSGTNNNTFADGGVAAPSTSYVDSGPAAAQQHVPHDFLPEESFSTAVDFPPSNASTYHSSNPANSAAWSLLPPSSSSATSPSRARSEQHQQQQQPRSFYGQQLQPLPQRSRAQVTPTIRVTTDFAPQAAGFVPQPQDAIYSASSSSSLPHTDYAYNTTYNTTSSGHLSPQGPTTYMPQDSDMQTPPRSARNSPSDTTMMGDVQTQFSRKRSHSTMSQPDHQPVSAHPSRAGSVLSNSGISPADENSPRGSRAFKRGDPPTNNENKYVCDFSDECRGLVFDRKCEWSKHMDKHDRPYRCPHPSCAKLQGFTYSGGLLRHEREVHGKHGGPKAQLMCPVEGCKRHVGKGFTRKENLNEHLRRVHSFKDQQPSQGSIFRRDTQDSMLIGGTDDAGTPASRTSEAVDFDENSMISPALGNKRKRSLPPGIAASERATSEEVEDLKQELKRLRSETERKDDRIRQMEESGLAQDQKIRTLEEAVLQLQQQHQHQQHQHQQANVHYESDAKFNVSAP